MNKLLCKQRKGSERSYQICTLSHSHGSDHNNFHFLLVSPVASPPVSPDRGNTRSSGSFQPFTRACSWVLSRAPRSTRFGQKRWQAAWLAAGPAACLLHSLQSRGTLGITLFFLASHQFSWSLQKLGKFRIPEYWATGHGISIDEFSIMDR